MTAYEASEKLGVTANGVIYQLKRLGAKKKGREWNVTPAVFRKLEKQFTKPSFREEDDENTV